MMEIIAKRAIALIGKAGEKHVDFPASILSGLQSSSGASVQSLVELDKFIHGLFAFDLPKNFFIQMAVAGSCIATLFIVGLATIYSRVTQRAFWIFKATRRSEGIYLVPNALNTFLLFEGVFAALWLAFIIIQFKGYWRQEDEMQKHVATFNLIIWWPLWIGAFMAGWGSFYTAPGALDKGPLRSNGLGRFLPRPLVINIFCIGTPLILIISLIPLIVLTQHHLNDAFGAYKIFRSQIASSIASAGSNSIAASPEQSMQFLSTANAIWDMQVKTGYYMTIGYAIWPVWAAIFLIFYMPAGGYLVYLVWGQLRRQKSLLIELREKYIEEEAIERRKRELAREDGLGPGNQVYTKKFGTNSTGGAVAMRQIISLGEESAPRDPTSSLLFQPLTSSQEQATTIASPETVFSPPITPSTVVQGRTMLSQNHQNESNEQKRSNGSSEGEEGQDVFFPPMKPEMQKRAGTKRLSSVGGTPYTRYKYLRRCFINLTVLYSAIVLGAALYLGVSASLARYLYKSYQKGPEDLAHIVYYTCVIAAWGAVVFGSACIAAIMARLIDPANGPNSGSKSESGEKGARGQGGFARCVVTANSPFTIRKKLSHSSTSPLQEKTRTLPAVPESVGATVDELMTGISIPAPVQHTRSFGPSRYPRRMSSLDEDHLSNPPPMQNRALKFEMHSRPEGGLILEPSVASSFAETGGEESNLWPANSSRTSTSLRLKQIKRKNNLKSINTTPTFQSDFPSSAVGSSNNSSQRSLPSRRKHSLTEPTAAPPPPPAKPLAPARTPPLSPQYMAMIKDGKIGRMDDGLNGLDYDNDVAPIPPKKMGFSHSQGDWHMQPSFTSVQHPLMSETSTSATPDPHMALFSGLRFGVIPVQGTDVSGTQSDESDIETPMANNSFSAHRQMQRGSRQEGPAPVTIDKKASISTVKTSPSVAVTPIMTRNSGLKSGISPFASPTIGLPPTPTSATAFTIPASDDCNGHQQIYTDRQKVPMQSDNWTPLAQGWFRIPDVQNTITTQPEVDSLDGLNKGELDNNPLASPRRPSLPLPELAAVHSSQHSPLYARRRSEAPIPTTDRMSGLFF